MIKLKKSLEDFSKLTREEQARIVREHPQNVPYGIKYMADKEAGYECIHEKIRENIELYLKNINENKSAVNELDQAFLYFYSLPKEEQDKIIRERGEIKYNRIGE